MKNTVTVFICFVVCLLSGQSKTDLTFYHDFNFIRHLTVNKLFVEAESEKLKLFNAHGITQTLKDSVNYSLGVAYLESGLNDQARKSFLMISEGPFFYYKARYLAAMMDAEKGRADSAIAVISLISESSNPDLNELKDFELAGLSLLKEDATAFDSISKAVSFKNPLLNTEIANLRKYAADQKKIKRKSPLMAGTLSALVPGLGKVYAGNNGQALASFLTCGLMAAVAGENYLNHGMIHPQTLFFTGLFTVFYIGNIWGSAVSVQLVKIEKQLENKHNILVGLKLPVNSFFN